MSGQAGRLIEIDSLRGIAALWVVVFHFSFGVHYFWYPNDPVIAATIAPFATNIEGLLGVDLFFTISGFVIFMTLERSKSVVDFVVSRFSRLFPTYWVCLTLTVVAILALPVAVQTVTFGQFIANTSMLQAFVGVSSVETVYWSLAFELAFYALMLCVYAANGLERIEVLGSVWLALSALCYSLFPEIGAAIPWRLRIATVLPYVPLFFAGMLLYRIRSRGWTIPRTLLLAACLLARVATFGALQQIGGTVAIFTLCTAASLGWAPFLRWRPLVFLGTISYPLYLVHNSIGFRMQSAAVLGLGLGAWAGAALALAGVTLLAWGVSAWIERPAQAFIRSAYHRRKTGGDARPGYPKP